MVEYLTEELQIDGQCFPFQLCRKAERFGQVAVDHWWMNTRRLDGQRQRSAPNLDAITSYFWGLCLKHGTAQDPEVQESFILARLLPFARSHGSRRIFVDAHLTRPESQDSSEQEEQATLEGLLRGSQEKTLTAVEFNNGTAEILGPPVLPEEVQSQYWAVTGSFLGEARAALMRDGITGLQVAIAGWQQMMRLIGRRAGHLQEKQVLDILSYECRAAFHRCYSAVWWDLLPRLAEKYHLDRSTLDFLGLWHLDHCRESAQGPHASFHLFHGHIFGLHPSNGALLQTPTGREILAAWLGKPDSEVEFGRLLHAIFVALYHYVGQRDTSADSRRKQPISRSDAVLELERQSVGRVKRRRRPRKRPTDAR